MNGSTNVPSRLTNAPMNRTQTSRGSPRRFCRRVRRSGSIGRRERLPVRTGRAPALPPHGSATRPAVVGHVGGRVDPCLEVRGRLRLAGDRADRDHARPHVQRQILVGVERRAGANLRRGLVEREREDGGLFVFHVVRRPRVRAPAPHDVFGQRALRHVHLFAVGHLARRAEHDHRPVVHGVLRGGTRQHQPVDDGRLDADVRAAADRAQGAAGLGPVDVEDVVDADVDRGDHAGLTFGRDPGEMTDEGFVQDGADRGTVVHPALGMAVDARAVGGGFGHGRDAIRGARDSTRARAGRIDSAQPHSFTRQQREAGENPARSRHCDRGADPTEPTGPRRPGKGSGERGSGSQETCAGSGSVRPSHERRRSDAQAFHGGSRCPPVCPHGVCRNRGTIRPRERIVLGRDLGRHSGRRVPADPHRR